MNYKTQKEALKLTQSQYVFQNHTYFGLIMKFLTPLEYVKSLSLVSKYHYSFLKNPNNDLIIQRIFCREFGERLNNLFFLESSIVYQSILLFYKTWCDDFLLFKNKDDINNKFSAQYNILNKLQSENFMVRMHIFRPKQYILKYWFEQIAKSINTDLQHLGFDTETNSFIVLSDDNEDDDDEQVIQETLMNNNNRESIILSSQYIDMNPKKIHFMAAVLSVCMARIPSIFNSDYFRTLLNWIKYEYNIRLNSSHFYEILWMSFDDDINRNQWIPICLEIILDGFEQKLKTLKTDIDNNLLSINNVRNNVNKILKLHLEWVLFNLHLFIIIHKSLCEENINIIEHQDIDQLFDEKLDVMKKIFSVNDQNQRFKDLANKISPSLESNQSLMDRIFILASTWPSSDVNEMNRSLKVYVMFKDIFGYETN